MTEVPIAPQPTAPKFADIRAGFTPGQKKAFGKLTAEQKKQLRQQGLMWGLVAADAAPGGTQSLLQLFLEAAEKGLLNGTDAANTALQRLIRQSAWGRQYTSTQENFLLGKYQYPEQYDRAMNGITIKTAGKTQRTPGWVEWVKNTALSNGATITDEEAIELAEQILMNGLQNNTEAAERIVLGYVDFEQADLLGKAGVAQDTISRYAKQYGVKLSPQESSRLIQENVFGRSTLNDIVDKFRRDAASKYSNFSDRIMNGETVESIANPYRELAQELLEAPDISMEDSLILDAMTGKNQEGKPKYSSLSDFKRAIKADARWQKTDNARSEYFNVGQRILKDFGFLG
jgi:hypothetical protein